MKILHIAPAYKPAFVYGGPIFSVSALAEGMVKAGHEVQVFTTTANGKSELDRETGEVYDLEGVKVRYFKRVTGDFTHFTPSLLRHLRRTLRSYDVVHIHTWWNFVALLSALVCIRRGIRPIVSPRGMLSYYTFGNRNSSAKSVMHRFIGKSLLRKSLIHATVENELEECQQAAPGCRGFVLPNILTIPEYHASTTSNGVFNLVFIGRIHPKKNLEALIEALPGLEMPWRLQVIGPGDEEYLGKLAELAKKNTVEDRIEWTGPLNGDEKYGALASGDLMVLLSYSENFANTVIESLSVGMPVLLSDHVGMSAYVDREDLGRVVPLDVPDLAGEINKLYRDTQWREKIRQTAPAKVRHDFSSDYLIPLYLQEYKKKLSAENN